MASHPTKIDWTTRNRRPDAGETPSPPRERARSLTDGNERYATGGRGKAAEKYPAGPRKFPQFIENYDSSVSTGVKVSLGKDMVGSSTSKHLDPSQVAVRGGFRIDPEEGHD